ncbi:MAG: trypsin-like peptidase domain-containing protein [Bacilli bacterium]|nr:trypsin-like peptidase domain-containing protein [Bacilli bacterium]
MKKFFYVLIMFIVLVLCSCNKKTTVVNNVINQTVDVEDSITVESLEDVICNTISNVEQSVVGVKAFNDKSLLKKESFGSGVVISKNNNKYYIVTNRHVVVYQDKAYDNIDIYLGNIDVYLDARLISYDEKIDLALIEVETNILLKVCELGSDETIKKGKFCIAIGSPYQLETYYNTVIVGNISNINCIITESNYFYKELTNEYIQTTATLNVGCSGGGLFDLSGKLIGINTWKLIDSSDNIEGMNFSISVDKVKSLFSSYLQ